MKDFLTVFLCRIFWNFLELIMLLETNDLIWKFLHWQCVPHCSGSKRNAQLALLISSLVRSRVFLSCPHPHPRYLYTQMGIQKSRILQRELDTDIGFQGGSTQIDCSMPSLYLMILSCPPLTSWPGPSFQFCLSSSGSLFTSALSHHRDGETERETLPFSSTEIAEVEKKA